jgi:hypothetical protein
MRGVARVSVMNVARSDEVVWNLSLGNPMPEGAMSRVVYLDPSSCDCQRFPIQVCLREELCERELSWLAFMLSVSL